MNKIYSALIVALTLSLNITFAQQYNPVEQTVPMDKAMPNAWVINADDAPIEDIRKAFRKYAKSQLDVKAKKSGRDMVVAKEASIPRFSSDVGDLKARFYAEGDQTKVAVAFMPGYDLSLSTDENQSGMESMRKFTKEFVRQYKSELMTERLEDREKRRKSIESDLKKNQREYKKLEKSVSKVEKKLNDSDTEENEAFELKNDKVEDEAQIMALDEIMANQQQEIERVDGLIQEARADLGQLETMFAEPVARQDDPITAPPTTAPQDSTSMQPEIAPSVSTPTSSPEVDY